MLPERPLNFTIPYVDALGAPHTHRSDFIVRLVSGLMVALEVKGYARELDDLKTPRGTNGPGRSTHGAPLAYHPASIKAPDRRTSY